MFKISFWSTSHFGIPVQYVWCCFQGAHLTSNIGHKSSSAIACGADGLEDDLPECKHVFIQLPAYSIYPSEQFEHSAKSLGPHIETG